MDDDAGGGLNFEVSTRLLGSHIQFRDGSTTRLGVNHIAKKLFREGRTGAILDLSEMLSSHCPQAGTTPEALAGAAEAHKQGSGMGKCALNATFAPGDFGFRANEGMKDVERIEFDVEFTVRARKRT